MILAGDIGGTKTNLALFENGLPQQFASFPSQKYPNLKEIVLEYLQKVGTTTIQRAAFAIAGPVHKGICRATNLPWIVDAQEIARVTGIKEVFLLNDLEANAYAVEILPKESLLTLQEGEKVAGTQVVVSPGTGLGEAGLFFDGKCHTPMASEGGHADFAPSGEEQIELLKYLTQKFGHVSYERILSGPGIFNLYLFLKETKRLSENQEFHDAAEISKHALEKSSLICQETLRLFVTILGQEIGNMALKFMSRGGIFIGGGICPKIQPLLKDPSFLKGYTSKGRFETLLKTFPIYLILDDHASLKGAANFLTR